MHVFDMSILMFEGEAHTIHISSLLPCGENNNNGVASLTCQIELHLYLRGLVMNHYRTDDKTNQLNFHVKCGEST